MDKLKKSKITGLSDDELDAALLRCLDGTADKDEYDRVWQWAQTPEHRQYYRNLLDAVVASHLLKHTTAEQEKKTFKVYHNDTGKRHFIMPWRWIAAAAMVLIVGMAGLYLRRQADEPAVAVHYMTAPDNERKQFTLSDSSRVWLNKGSSLTWSDNFGKQTRQVELCGEAYFEVAKDAAHPFVVTTDKLSIEVLGTQFNVRAYAGEHDVVATLAEGQVKVTTGKNVRTLHLPGQQLSLDRSTDQISVVKGVNLNLLTMWKDESISFKEETLENVFLMMEKSLNVNITIANKKTAGRRLTGGFMRNDSPEKVLKILQKSINFKYQITDKEIIIK